jgi:hypothetical protein
LAYNKERLSLFAGVLFCAWLVGGELRRVEKLGALAVLALCYGLLYRDEAERNRLEDKVDALVGEYSSGVGLAIDGLLGLARDHPGRSGRPRRRR